MTFQYIQHNFISFKRSSRKFIIENRQFNLEGVIPHTLHDCRVSNLPYEGGSQTFFLLVSSLFCFETTLARTESLYYFSFILFAFDSKGHKRERRSALLAKIRHCATHKRGKHTEVSLLYVHCIVEGLTLGELPAWSQSLQCIVSMQNISKLLAFIAH